jgi:hypothetical protein
MSKYVLWMRISPTTNTDLERHYSLGSRHREHHHTKRIFILADGLVKIKRSLDTVTSFSAQYNSDGLLYVLS